MSLLSQQLAARPRPKYRNILKRAAALEKKLERWAQMSLGSRICIAHPDLCLYLTNYFKVSWRYLIKIGASRGYLVLQFGWLSATVRW